MKRKKSIKNSLLVSALALLISVSMLIGTTFAWFTDSVSSTGNKIQSGTLKLKLEEKTATGENGWKDITDLTDPLFNYTCWEPGYTDYAVLRLTNDGTLALKWQAKLVHNGTMNELAEVIDVYVTEFAGEAAELPAHAAAATAWDYKGTLQQFVENFSSVTKGELVARESACLGIALHMREEAGNEYQDKDLGTFDIQIFTTQNTVEPDGFENNGYDEGAEFNDGTAVYYRDLRSALSAIGGGSVQGDGTSQQSSGISVRETENGYTLELRKNIVETAPITVAVPVKLDLNGKSLSFDGTQQGLVVNGVQLTVDGSKEGSGIHVTNDGYATAIQVNSGSCTLKGGSYSATTTNGGTPAAPNPCIQVSGGKLNVSDAEITATSTTGSGTVNGVLIGADGEAVITGSKINAASANVMDVLGVNNKGVAVISDCIVDGWANYTANAAGTNYATRSMGIHNEGTMTLRNCHVVGTHSGVRSTGTLLVDGGIYESYGHGGLYIAGAGTTSYVRNATVRYCEMPAGYVADAVAGTNSAGMYIGGASNMTVYMDNCVLFGPFYPAILRNSGGEKNNALYISNSTVEKVSEFRGFRGGGENNVLYSGSGNSFTPEDKHVNTGKGWNLKIEETGISYKSVIDTAFGG